MRKAQAVMGLAFGFLLAVFRVYGDENTVFRLVRDSGDAEKYPDAAVLVIFDSTSVIVEGSGLSFTTSHTLTKVLKPSGAIALSVQRFGYDPLSAHIDVQRVRIFHKDGSSEDIPLEKVIDLPAPARMIYWGVREKMVPVGRLEVGEALEMITFRKGFTYALLEREAQRSAGSGDERYIPPMRGHFYDIVPFWSSTPVLRKTYSVSLPADKPLQYRVYNGELSSSLCIKGDRLVYSWEKLDISPFKSESDMVAISDVAPKLLLSTSPDWEAKSRWFYGVNRDYGSFEVTPDILEKVNELVRGKKTDEEKVHVLTHWVAEEIRYSGLSMGPGEGYTLHKGEMTFRDRCGVCKDKAGMLVTMLRAAGFESYAAMTMAGSRIDRIPADQFNHCVTIWKKGTGDFVLLDPTWVPGVRELWSSAEQQQEYLMGLPEGADLKSTPVSPPENHFFRIRGLSELQSDGTLEGRIVLTAEGQVDARIRRNLTRALKTTWPSYFEKAIFAISSRAQLISVLYNDPYDLSDPMTITLQYRIPRYAIPVKDRLVFVPVVARHPFADRGTNYYLHQNIDLEERSFDFQTRCSKLIDFEETVTLPKGYVVSHQPEFTPVSGEAADFEAQYSVKGRKLMFRERFVMKKRIYPAGQWSNFRMAVKSVLDVSKSPVVLVQK
jgi:transglutaminase-like putative cysteine protease